MTISNSRTFDVNLFNPEETKVVKKADNQKLKNKIIFLQS